MWLLWQIFLWLLQTNEQGGWRPVPNVQWRDQKIQKSVSQWKWSCLTTWKWNKIQQPRQHKSYPLKQQPGCCTKQRWRHPTLIPKQNKSENTTELESAENTTFPQNGPNDQHTHNEAIQQIKQMECTICNTISAVYKNMEDRYPKSELRTWSEQLQKQDCII